MTIITIHTHPGSLPFRGIPERVAMRSGQHLSVRLWGTVLDYVVHEGRPLVLDLNKTPGDSAATGLPKAAVPWLAKGIERWL